MDFNEYQVESRKTAIYPNIGSNFIYPALGLAGEVGEVCEKIKKIIRDKNSIISDEDRDSIKKEVGDILWYISNLAYEFNIEMNDIALTNIAKLKSRQDRGKLQGSGDNR